MTEESKPMNSWSDEKKWQFLLRHERLGELLVRAGKLKIGQLEKALKEQEISNKPLGEIIVENKFITKDEILATLESQKLIRNTSEKTIRTLKEKERE